MDRDWKTLGFLSNFHDASGKETKSYTLWPVQELVKHFYYISVFWLIIKTANIKKKNTTHFATNSPTPNWIIVHFKLFRVSPSKTLCGVDTPPRSVTPCVPQTPRSGSTGKFAFQEHRIGVGPVPTNPRGKKGGFPWDGSPFNNQPQRVPAFSPMIFGMELQRPQQEQIVGQIPSGLGKPKTTDDTWPFASKQHLIK